MSVAYAAADMVIEVEPPWTCADCGGQVDPPAVTWWASQWLILHANCARALGGHLIADSRECELASAQAPHWRRRAIAAVRHRLKTEEEVPAA